MKRIWSRDPQQIALLRSLMVLFELAVPDPSSKDKDLLVPCLVESEPEEDRDRNCLKIFFTYKISVAPPLGLLSRTIVKALNLAMEYDPYKLIKLFRKGCTFRLKNGAHHIRMDVGVDNVKFQLNTKTPYNLEEIISFFHDMDSFFEDQIAEFTREAQCINCTKSFETPAWVLFCFNCAYDFMGAMATTSGMLYDVLLANQQDYRLVHLCGILDQANFWRKFGGHELVRTPVNKLNRHEKTMKADPEHSPSREILNEWMHHEEATVSNFLAVMKEIECHTAVQLVMEYLMKKKTSPTSLDMTL